MSDSREESLDWLRSFELQTLSTIELSSESELPSDHSPVSDEEDGVNLSKLFKKEARKVLDINDNDNVSEPLANKPAKGKSPKKNDKVKRSPEKKRKNEDYIERAGKRVKGKGSNIRNTLEEHGKPREQNHSIWSLSSDSDSSQDARPVKKDIATKKEVSPDKDMATEYKKESPKTRGSNVKYPMKQLEKEDEINPAAENINISINEVKNDIATKREASPDKDLVTEYKKESPKTRGSKVKLPMKQLKEEDERNPAAENINSSINEENDTKDDFVKEENGGRHPGHQDRKALGSSSKVPLFLSEKVQRSKALVECEGDSIDLSGDAGSVGRIVISDDPSKNHEMFLDLKGTIYKTTIVPSRTFCVVSFGPSEAKIEAIMNDYIQLKPQSNVYEVETMVEGTLDGFSFDSDDEADKATAQAQADQHKDDGEQVDGKKTKGKPAKTSGTARKKGKPAGGKPIKKVKKKTQVSKKGKTKK